MRLLPALALSFLSTLPLHQEARAESMSTVAQFAAQVERDIAQANNYRDQAAQRARAQRLDAMSTVLIIRADTSMSQENREALDALLRSIEILRRELLTDANVAPVLVDSLLRQSQCVLQGIDHGSVTERCRRIIDGGREIGNAVQSLPEPDPADVQTAALTTGADDNVYETEQKTRRLVQIEQLARRSLIEDGRAPYSVSIYGHSVDVDLGRLFVALAETNPDLLRPIPMDRDFRLRKCVNQGFKPDIVYKSLNKVDRVFRDMLLEAEKVWSAGAPVRYTLIGAEIPAKVERTKVSVPATLDDFQLEDALSLITADFSVRYGFYATTDTDLLHALRNLEIVLGQERFVSILGRVLSSGSDRLIASSQVGTMVQNAGQSPAALWARVYRETINSLNCNDANEILEAYGLVYRNGDYGNARRTLELLRDHTGYAAVPGITILKTQNEVLEARRQNCAAFGPYQWYQYAEDDGACNLGSIEVDGRSLQRVLAGGVELLFLTNQDGRNEIRRIIRKLERVNRDGDKLRWHDTSHLGIRTQSKSFFSIGLSQMTDEEHFPCVINLSSADKFSDMERIRTHVRNYRDNFFPTGEMAGPEELSYVFVIDAFKGHQNDGVKSELMKTAPVLQSLISSGMAMIKDATEDTADYTSEVGLLGFEPEWEKVCEMVNQQFVDLTNVGAPLSHGEFIRALLVGGSSKSDEVFGNGLLNPEGAYDSASFKDTVVDWSVYDANTGRLSQDELIDHVIGSKQRIKRTVELARAFNKREPAPAVFNISLSQSFLNAGSQDVKNDAQDLIERLKLEMALIGDKGLFVVAAGQPVQSSGDDVLTGQYLSYTPAGDAKVTDSDCSFFPACLSDRKNVITVGAIKPSDTAGQHERPILIKWANHGSAVTLAAPGQGVWGVDQGFTAKPDSGQLNALRTDSLRDGTSVATVFVTGIAAQLAARYPDIRASQIKKRLVSTARPYWTPTNAEQSELLSGYNPNLSGQDEQRGKLFAGVIDPEAALRDPRKFHVTYRKGQHKGTTREFERIELTDGVDTHPKLTVFGSTSSSSQPHHQCSWGEIYRIHIQGAFEKDTIDPPVGIFQGSVACQDSETSEKISAGSGPLGTKNRQHNLCLVEDNCFQGQLEDGSWEPLKFSEIRDIYFPVLN